MTRVELVGTMAATIFAGRMKSVVIRSPQTIDALVQDSVADALRIIYCADSALNSTQPAADTFVTRG